jgi:hypothetical protein
MNIGLLIAGIVQLCLLVPTADSSFSCTFAREAWQPKDWIMVKSARWDFFQENWIQKDDCIQNPVPDRPIKTWYDRTKGDESYTSMVYGRKFQGDVVVKTTLEFDPKFAPLIVLANDLGKSPKGQPEYRDHTEIVFFINGINVWTHMYDEQKKKPTWQLLAFNRITLKPNTRYPVEVSKKGKILTIKVDGHCFGVFDSRLPDACYIGITGCEGYSQFYDFSVTPLKK